MKKLIIFFVLMVVTSCSAKDQIVTRQDSVTIANLTSSVYTLPFKYKKIIIAQAVLETGWFKSKNFKVNNNLFGMKAPSTRVTTSDSSINGYAHYQNWELSVIDYYLMLSVRQDVIAIKSEKEYYNFVDQVYSEMGHSYSDQLKSIIVQLKLDELEPKKIIHKTSHKKSSKKHN